MSIMRTSFDAASFVGCTQAFRGIAQSGSALALGARCREFKSLYPDQFLIVNFENDSWINGDCSSVGRAIGCGPIGRRFESDQSPAKIFGV